MSIFEKRESSVRSYCRTIPAVFRKANGAVLTDIDGRTYLDFLAGAGSLNYGHNPEPLRTALLNYITGSGVTHSLDLHTDAKAEFLEAFERRVLVPRGLNYRVQFTGPTGANAVEAALKLARKITGRRNIIAFTNGFHGVSLGALAATGNGALRHAAGVELPGISRMPYDGYLGTDYNTLDYLEKVLRDASSGIDAPAAVIVECVQGEGGLTAASDDWLQGLAGICKRHRCFLIVDDIQAGCGRTGSFFSFESAKITPDIVTLSKSLSGYGLPLSVVLIAEDLDVWEPGEHNGTFRGNNHAFVTASTALDRYWSCDALMAGVAERADIITRKFQTMREMFPQHIVGLRGRGMMQGIVMESGRLAGQAVANCFSKGLIIESSGAYGEVIKCLAPLTISEKELHAGLHILSEGIAEAREQESN